jgi:hypothetical protein
MFYTLEQIKAASTALDAARQSFDCTEPRRDVDGADESVSGVKYGTHGAAYLQVDPETGKIRCGACAGDLAAIAQQKTARRDPKTGRVHFVSADATPTVKKTPKANKRAAKKGARK